MSNLFDFVSMNRRAALLVGVLMLVLTGASLASAEDLVQPDGRLNQVAHFGGDSAYCVDANYVATDDYPAQGGFRLLNSIGQELWFVPAAEITAAVDESVATGNAVLVGEGQGTYGPTSLYTYYDGKTQVFVYSGVDEFGKMNTLTFNLCTPVGPIPQPESEPEVLCHLVQFAKGFQPKALSPIFGAPPTRTIPCGDCPRNFGKLFGKVYDPNSSVSSYCVEYPPN